MRIRQLTVAAAAALLLTACGGGPLDGKTGPEVAAQAADALEKAGAVHVKGTMDEGGESGEIDLQLQGKDVTGTITMSGVELQLLSVDDAVYLQAPPEFWGQFGLPDEAAAMFDGKWVIVPSEAVAQFQELSLDGIINSLRKPGSKVKDEVKSKESDGKSVVVIEQEDGSTLSVLDEDPAYPVELTNKGDSAGTMTFSRYGEKESIEAPADALDLEQLAAG
ncbi:MAG: putative Lipoprotein [Blastococcus sp.]|jgi:hypothetical protein|nr:putative Lipoprotein [Blastococcus sp.]